MLPVCVGAGLALGMMAVMLLVAVMVPVADFPIIAYACAANGMDAGYCSREAIGVGVQSVVAFAFVLAACAGVCRVRRTAAEKAVIHPAATTLLLGFSFALIAVHFVALVMGPVHASRLDESDYFANFVSLENLLWPLLVQFYVMQTGWKQRLPLLAALVAIMTLTPFRAVLFAIIVFAFVVPVAAAFWQALRNGWASAAVRQLAGHAAVAAVVGTVSVWGGYINTQTRAPSVALAAMTVRTASAATASIVPTEPPERVIAAPPQSAQPPAQPQAAAPQAAPPLPPTDVSTRLLQRLAFPLFQAVIAGHLAGDPDLPGLQDEVARKFRLSNAPTLEQFLFRRIFGGETTGQVTSLYYGEARVYAGQWAMPWMIVGPMLIVGVAFLLLRRGVEAGTIFGIALWRSSFAGLVPILPALTLQVLAMLVLAAFGAMLNRRARLARSLTGLLNAVLAVALTMTLVMQVWLLAQMPQRGAVLAARFTVAEGCALVSPTWVPILVNKVFADNGLSISAASIAATLQGATVGVPYGMHSAALMEDITARIATVVQCAQPTAAPVTLGRLDLLPWTPNPLEFLMVLATAAALAAFAAPFLRVRARTFRPARTVLS